MQPLTNIRGIDRRGFLAAVSATALVGRSAWGAPIDFKLGAQSYTFRRFTFEQAIERIAKAGLTGVELFRKHLDVSATKDQIAAAKRLCADHGVTPRGFGVERFSKDHAANQRVFAFAKEVGFEYLSADPDPDSFESLDKLCEETKIAVAIHPHGPAGKSLHRWYSAEIIMDAVKDHHPLIGTCLDTGHLIRSAQPPFGKKLDPAQQIRVMGARNFAIHLKDHDNQTRTDVIYGKGALDVPGVLAALRDVQFKGSLNLEYEANEENPSPDVEACVQVLKKCISEAK